MREAVRIPKLLNGYKGQKELREDVEEQLGQLFPKHFLVTVPAKAFSNYPRYVAAHCDAAGEIQGFARPGCGENF